MIISSGVMTIISYKGLKRNLEMKNIDVWILSNIWGLRQARDTKFAADNKILII